MSNSIYPVTNTKVRYCQNCLKSSIKALSERAVFTSPHEFFLHLREYHCTKEGGSFVCLYGPNGVCPSLPLDGVSELDYQEHVWRDHLQLDRNERSSFMLSQTSCPINQNTSSNPSVVQDQHKWTVYMSQINLPALLNDPRLNRRETDFFTKTWGESFDKSLVQPSQYIPTITHDHFQQFLLRTSSRRRQSVRSAETVQERKNNDVVLSKMEDFEAIPKIFFNSNFSLLEKETFYQVLPWSSIEKHQGAMKSHQQSPKLLQEKLSHYLDLVEVQITKQISAKSDAFFEAMLYQNTLQEHLQKTCKSVQFLRDKIKKLHNMLTLQPLQVIHKTSSSLKYKQIHEKLKFMATVQQTQPMIQLLLSTNDFLGALDLISTTQEVLQQELAGIQCFRHLGSQLHEMEKLIVRMVEDEFLSFTSSFLLQPINTTEDFSLKLPPLGISIDDKCSNIDEERLVLIILGLYRLTNSNFLESFENESCNSLRNIVRQVAVETLITSETPEAEMLLTNQLRNLNLSQWLKLLRKVFISLVVVLQRVQKIANIFQFVAKQLVYVNSSDKPSESTGEQSSGCSLKKSSSFDGLLNDTFDNQTPFSSNMSSSGHLNDLGRSEVHDVGAGGERDSTNKSKTITQSSSSSCVLGDMNALEGRANEDAFGDEGWKEGVREILKDCDPILSEGRSFKIVGALSEHLCRICEHAHDRCYKLFNIRIKDGFLDNLSTNDFLDLSQHIEWFVAHTERICGRKSSLLRGTLLNQTNKLINKFHEERRNKLCLILDHERWKQADVPCEFQELVDHIERTGQLSLPTKKLDSGRSQEYLYANGERYVVVGTALILLKLVIEYCEFVDKLPFAAPEILNRIVELLKTFNSRTCQLILGAGALHLVGLKTISTRNLGLATRCLQLMMSYFPMVKSHFHKRLHSKQLSMIKHFEHLYKDYRDHIAEISVKLVSIMDTVLQGILNKYEIKPTSSSLTFELLQKQTTRFHEAISDLLPREQVESILRQFHLNFARNFKRQLNVLNFSRDSPNQLSLVEADLKSYVNGIRALPGFEDFSMELDDILA